MKTELSPSMGIVPIYDLLYRLGIIANCIGFFYTAYAVFLALQNPERLLFVEKWLYPAVAHHYHTSPPRVERGIRIITEIAWNNNRPLLEKLAHLPLPCKPTNSAFLEILTYYFYSHRAA